METAVTTEDGTQGDKNKSLPPPPPQQVAPILDENENISQAIENTLPYFEAEKDRLESVQISVNQKSESPEKTEILKHINQEKAIVEGKIADLKTKSKVKDIKELITEEKEARKVRKKKEDELLELLDKISAGNPFVTANEINGATTENARQQLEELKREAKTASSQQATQEKQGSASSEQEGQQKQGNISQKPKGNEVLNNEEFHEVFGNYDPPARMNASTGTEPSSGVTVKNVEMVCNKLKKKIIALEEQIAKLQESNTGTSSNAQKHKIITTTNPQKANKGTSKQSTGGRKSRNNKKKKKSKAKKNKTRRRRRSKA